MNRISKTEDILFEAMNKIGLNPKRQYPISKMHVDFAFPEKKLVIEVDGAYKRTKEGMKTLFERKRACEKEGWKVENFTAEEVYENPDKIAWRIKKIWEKYKTSNKKIISKKKNDYSEKYWEDSVKIAEGETSNEFYVPEKQSNSKKKILLILMIIGTLVTLFLILKSSNDYGKVRESFSNLPELFDNIKCGMTVKDLNTLFEGHRTLMVSKGSLEKPEEYIVTFTNADSSLNKKGDLLLITINALQNDKITKLQYQNIKGEIEKEIIC